VNGIRVSVFVGTDHHPFSRLVDWADRWAAAHPDDDVFVQYGWSTAPEVATGQSFLTPRDLRERCAKSDVVISHGGPGTIMDARGAGHRPIVVARDPARGEHVDQHQLRFAAWAAEKQFIHSVDDERELDLLVEVGSTRDAPDAAGPGHDTQLTAGRVREMHERPRSQGRLPRAVDATTVLYIGGWGRSGSTLLECLIARLDGVVVLGEVKHLWERALQRDELCACGEAFSRCSFWGAVGDEAFGGWDRVDVGRVLELKGAVDRQRRMHATTRRRPGRDLRADLLEYSAYYRKIYAAAAVITGANIVVDSSKEVPTALALSHDRHLDLRVMHIVRDSRGSAYSWSKVVPRPEVEGQDTMPTFSPAWSTAMWLSLNTAVSGLRYRGVPVTRLRYEDLVADAASTVRIAWQELDLPGTGELPMVDDTTIELAPTHSVAGNPMRFRSGLTKLSHDNAWQTGMGVSDRQLVTLMSYPWLRLLGYHIK
jgi:UDP-N-acetylglucosamine transferase subunit ALG13